MTDAQKANAQVQKPSAIKKTMYPATKFANDVRAQIDHIQALINNEQTSKNTLEKAFQDFRVMVNEFESSYRTVRGVARHSISNDGQPVLMCNILQDQYERVTVTEMCQKYGIRCRNTFYRHLQKMQKSDWYQYIDQDMLNNNEEYRKHVFANDLNEHRELLPEKIKDLDLSDHYLVCGEF